MNVSVWIPLVKKQHCAQIEEQMWQNVRMMWVFMFPYYDEFVQELFVDVCLDFSIAQYMEDCSLF